MLAYNQRIDKVKRPETNTSQGLSQATLDIAKVYYSLGDFEQALEWCQSYLAKYGACDDVIKLINSIHLSADSTSLKAQAQQFLQRIY